MTDEQNKPQEDEVSEEQLDGVSGGATAANPTVEDMTLAKQIDKATTPIFGQAVDGNSPGVAEIVVRTTDDED
jgi:type VI protein secretion system component Hcp